VIFIFRQASHFADWGKERISIEHDWGWRKSKQELESDVYILDLTLVILAVIIPGLRAGWQHRCLTRGTIAQRAVTCDEFPTRETRAVLRSQRWSLRGICEYWKKKPIWSSHLGICRHGLYRNRYSFPFSPKSSSSFRFFYRICRFLQNFTPSFVYFALPMWPERRISLKVSFDDIIKLTERVWNRWTHFAHSTQ
jgi:hypothetical protein